MGLVLIGFAFRKEVTVVINGEAYTFQTFAPTVEAYLEFADVPQDLAEILSTVSEQSLVNGAVIRVLNAELVQIWADGKEVVIESTDRRPGNLLALAGVQLFPGDQVLNDGVRVQADKTLAGPAGIDLQLVRAAPITVVEGNKKRVIYSTAATLGQALWEADIRLQAADYLSLPLETPLDGPVEVSLLRVRRT